MRPVPVGTQGSYTLLVTAEYLASRFKDPMLPPVFATPMAIKPYFEPGETAVGSRVDVRHLAATPAGRRVTAWAEVTQVARRRIVFRVWALDGDERIGEGTHERMLIELAPFNAKLARKAARGGAAGEEA